MPESYKDRQARERRDKEARRRISEYLFRERMKAGYREGKTISQSQYAMMLDMPQSSFASIENQSRLPGTDNAHKLAAYFGDVIYEILDMPILVPRDKHLARVAEVWHTLPEDARKRIADTIEDEALMWEERDAKTPAPGANFKKKGVNNG